MTIFNDPDSTFLDHLILAGITLAVGLVAWLAVHYTIRVLVKRALAERSYLQHRSLRWAAPVLRNLDPVARALDNERRVQRVRTIGSLLNSLQTIIIAVVTGFYLLIAFNINIAPLLASVGIAGVAIGFGCQQLIRDFLAGIFITIEDQYGIGDVIQTSEVVGKVEYVGLRITRVTAEDGALWYLRNGEIMRLGNRSKGNYHPLEQEDESVPDVSPAPASAAAPGQVPASNTTTPHEPTE